MKRGYCYEPCKKTRWFCCHDCLRKGICTKEAQELSKGKAINYVPCTKKKEKCSIYHK